MGNDFDEDHRGAPPESWAAPFRKALSLRGRPESRLKWYLIWARRFAACLSGRPLHLATRNDAEGFLTTLASSPGIAAWQVEQATDALTILLGSVFGQEWARTIRIPAPPPPPDVPLPKGDEPVERLRYAIRCRRYSVRTEESYVFWVNRFLAFCRDGGVEQDADAVRAFLERLVIAEQMSASTQGQALNALVFHFKHVVGTPFGDLGEFQRSKRPRKLPVVLSREEVRRLLDAVDAAVSSPDGAAVRRRPAAHGGTAVAGEGHRPGSPSDLGPGRERTKGPGDGPSRTVAGAARRPSCRCASASRPGPGTRLRRDDLLARPRTEIPGRAPRVGLAVRFPGLAPLCRSGHRENTAPPPARDRPCSGPSGARRARRISRNPSAATRCGTASPPTCSSPARTSARCRNCSGTATSRRR